MDNRKALITGVTGQDGAYLSEFLLNKGYDVYGLRQPHALYDLENIEGLVRQYKGSGRFCLHYGDMTDGGSLAGLIAKVQPDEIYNLAAQSHVHVGFDAPEYTANVNGLGTLRLLEVIRALGMEDRVRFYQASTSEVFGGSSEPLHELSVMQPQSPYAASKVYAYWLVRNYREAYGIHASNGILFNHESPLRGEEFVTRKITLAVARIVQGEQDSLSLGNLDSKRDWGHAADYVEGMWLMLQQDRADDYVLATGQTYSVRVFVEKAFAEVGIEIAWNGKGGVDEQGVDAKTGRVLVRVSPEFYRPMDVNCLIGDCRKAQEVLGWQHKHDLDSLVAEMVATDMKKVRT